MKFRPKLWHLLCYLLLCLFTAAAVFVFAAGRGAYDHLSLRFGPWNPSGTEGKTFSAEMTALLESCYLGQTQLTTRDGITLTAERYAPAEPSHDWVLIAQGVQGRSMYMGEAALRLRGLGFNVLSFALRGHGESGGGRIGLGVRDKEDILSFLREIEKEDPDASVILFGVSMGAGAVLLASSEVPASVKAIVADSPYNDLNDLLKRRWGYDLPAAPFLFAASFVCHWDNGFWFGDASPQDAARNSKTPLLILHGEADEVHPVSMAAEIYASAAGVAPGMDEKTGMPLKATKFLVTFPGVSHAKGMIEAEEDYWTAVGDFFGSLK